ncbi:hypothetical protein BDD12DRAFT_868376 [Trichophaea hybrida]|nr:hypothetical protein BDD12DRAFT_868376 [Trichophaea hybrida]
MFVTWIMNNFMDYVNNEHEDEWGWTLAARISTLAYLIFVGFGILFFVTCRLFLTVESFLSLRSLPEGSFETVPWSNYWPHF